MTILLGSDHAGFALRRLLANWLIERGDAIAEMGAKDEGAYDYPDAAIELSSRIQRGDAKFGILICGTGIGMSITANRFRGIRAAVCWNETSAKLAREHNHANVLCLGARMTNLEEALRIMQAFLAEPESDETRHVRRVKKMDQLGDGAPVSVEVKR